MYRSTSEFIRYASEVFELFAEQENNNLSHVEKNNNESKEHTRNKQLINNSEDNITCSSDKLNDNSIAHCTEIDTYTEKWITLAAAKEAFYVLLGTQPSQKLIQALKSIISEEILLRQKVVCNAKIVSLETFIHFLLLFVSHHKDVVKGNEVINYREYEEYENEEETVTEKRKIEHNWSSTTWLLFNALLGNHDNKGYLTMEDLYHVSSSLSPYKLLEPNSLENAKSMNNTFTRDSSAKYKTYSANVIARVFTLLDTDRDGRIQYSDIKQ